MRLTGEDDLQQLEFGGYAFDLDENCVFEVLASAASGHRLEELPPSAAIRLVDRVVGTSRDYVGRQLDAVFERSASGGFRARVTTPFVVPTDGLDPAFFIRVLLDEPPVTLEFRIA